MSRQKNRVVFRKGKKVILRPICENDLERFLVWENDPELAKFFSDALPIYREEERDWLRKIHKDKNNHVVFAIDTIKGKNIGSVGLHRINWISRHSSLGIMIGNKKYWSNGYGTDAMMTILEFAFNSLNFHKVNLSVLSSNPRGHRCYVKCGFVDDGCRKQQFFKNGIWVDEITMSCFQADWKQVWEQYQNQ